MRTFEYSPPTIAPTEKPVPQITNEPIETPEPTSNDTPRRDPYRRECEFEPGYNWRTDPYYNEDAIRERMKAAKAEKQPASVNDRKDSRQ